MDVTTRNRNRSQRALTAPPPARAARSRPAGRLVVTLGLSAALAGLGLPSAAQAALIGSSHTIASDFTTDAVVIGNDTSGNGQLTVNNGATLTNIGSRTSLGTIGGLYYYRGDGYLGFNAGRAGTATVTGAGSLWQNSGSFAVGVSGQGTLNVEAGGKVTNGYGGYLGFNSGSTGTATVTGADSQWVSGLSLAVGEAGQGTLNVEAGGKVTNGLGYLGYGSGSTGTATVTGAGSLWENRSDLHVGRSGQGTLNVEAGGKVTSSDGIIGRNSGSTGTATVTGAGSHWENTYALSVGVYGQGTLNVEAGGKVTNSYGFIGRESGSTGTATVTGAGSHWQNNRDLSIGGSAGRQGSLVVSDGGKVSAGNGITIGGANGAGGQGSLTVSQGGKVSVGNGITIWQTGSLSGDGGVIVGNVTNHGLLAPGSSPGTLTIEEGDLILAASGTLALDIAGQSAGTQHDQLFVGGDLTIGGLLTLDFDGFTQPTADTTYDLIHVAGSITGDWTSFSGIQFLNPFADFDASLLSYSIVASTEAGYEQALRLTIAGVDDPADVNPVPEPATVALLALGGVALLARRRR